MKIIKTIIFILIMVLFSCNKSNDTMNYANSISNENTSDKISLSGNIFIGNHEISKVKDDKYFYAYINNKTIPLVVSFIWKNNDGVYISSYINSNRIRYEVDNTIEKPYIKFRWRPSNQDQTIQYHILQHVIYMVIVTNNDDFQSLYTYDSNTKGQNVINNEQ